MGLLSLIKKRYKKVLFTTPSHSGKFFIFSKIRQFYKCDISETDVHNPEEVLQKSEDKASKIYGTKQTLYLTNGSSSGIITAVLACVRRNEKVLIARGAHRCHENAVFLAGADPVFFDLKLIENWGINDKLNPEYLDELLKSDSQIKAVIVTSPTYEGVVSDIDSLKQVCNKYNCRLIVDEAHGALYPFSEKLPQSAVNIADFTVQSLHKTAGGLNPTALVHTMTDIDMRPFLTKINTTSPSYPLLASIEANINFLNSNRGRKILNRLLDKLHNILNLKSNCEVFAPDITKINLKHNKYTGYELSELLYDKFNVEDEKTNNISTMLLTGIGTDNLKLKKLEEIIRNL